MIIVHTPVIEAALTFAFSLVTRFLLILIPSGPSAMLLANIAEMVNVDQGPIAGYLLISV